MENFVNFDFLLAEYEQNFSFSSDQIQNHHQTNSINHNIQESLDLFYPLTKPTNIDSSIDAVKDKNFLFKSEMTDSAFLASAVNNHIPSSRKLLSSSSPVKASPVNNQFKSTQISDLDLKLEFEEFLNMPTGLNMNGSEDYFKTQSFEESNYILTPRSTINTTAAAKDDAGDEQDAHVAVQLLQQLMVKIKPHPYPNLTSSHIEQILNTLKVEDNTIPSSPSQHSVGSSPSGLSSNVSSYNGGESQGESPMVFRDSSISDSLWDLNELLQTSSLKSPDDGVLSLIDSGFSIITPSAKVTKPKKIRSSSISATRTVTTKNSQRSFKCSTCSKSFTRKESLKNHDISVHQNLRPHKCKHSNCPLTYSTPSDLRRHVREFHLNNSNKLFRCRGHDELTGSKWGCGRGFYRSYQLLNHWKSKRSEKNCGVPLNFDYVARRSEGSDLEAETKSCSSENENYSTGI